VNVEATKAAVEARNRRWLARIVWFLLALCAAVVVCLFLHRSKTFTLNAQTEEVRVEIRDPKGTSVWLPSAVILGLPPDKAPGHGPIRLDLEDGVNVTLARVQKGDVQLQVDWDNASRGATLSDGRPLKTGTVIHVPLVETHDEQANNASSFLLSFRGVLRVGDDVGPQVQRTLLGGNVTIIEKALLSEARYVVDSAALEPGDFVSWKRGSRNDEPVVVAGFVHAGDSEALTVVAHGAAESFQVVRYGAEAYDIAPPLISSISHDPELADIGAGILLFAGLLSLILPAKEMLELLPPGVGIRRISVKTRHKMHSSTEIPAMGSLFLLLGMAAVSSARAQDIAYVNSLPKPGAEVTTTQGNAWLFNRGGQCYAVTPRHVLLDAQNARDDHYARLVIARVGQQATEAVGERCAVFKKYDLAMLRVSGIARLSDCGRVLSGIADEDALLARSQQAALVTAASSGRFERTSLAIRQVTSNPDYFRVAVTADRDRLVEGMSGGLITIQDRLAGFLISVGSDSDTEGTGKVLRSDRAAILITRLLDSANDPGEVEGHCALPQASPVMNVPASRNLASATCGAMVTQWSAAPLSDAGRPESLVGAAGPNDVWRVEGKDEVTVGIQLCKTMQATVTSVSLDTTGCPAGDNQGADVEVSSQVVPEESFQSLGYGAVPAAGVLVISPGSPQASRRLLLRFVLHGGGVHRVCLHSVLVQ
jgi:hypothetical protein